MFKPTIIITGLLLVGCLHLASSQDEMCQKTKTPTFPHAKFCDFYYICDRSGGGPPRAYMEKCPNGLVYAGFQKGMIDNCDYPWKVGCPDGERVMGQPAIATENCPWSYGSFAHETSCTRYWQCWNGTASLQQCPYSLLYNEQLHTCDWPDNVPDCQKHPICQETSNGAVAIEKSCTRYWLCVGGYPRLQRCPAGLAFNPQAKKCELDYTVPGCEPPPTPPPVDDEDVEDNDKSKGNNRARPVA